MSDDPADIYITRDAFDQGELHGRLVCAIYVNDPGFVEVTVHPEDGGRFSEQPVPSATEPSGGLSSEDAVDVALGELPDEEEWEVISATAGPFGGLQLTEDNYPWAAGIPSDLWVWNVFLVRGDQGLDIVVDFLDGTVYGTVEYIVN